MSIPINTPSQEAFQQNLPLYIKIYHLVANFLLFKKNMVFLIILSVRGAAVAASDDVRRLLAFKVLIRVIFRIQLKTLDDNFWYFTQTAYSS